MSILSLDGAAWQSLMRLGGGGPQVIQARVLGFTEGKAVLQTQGKTLVAESEVPLKVGQELRLQVLGQQEGRVWVRPLPTATSGSPATEGVSQGIDQVLKNLGLAPGPKTAEAAILLLRAGLPITAKLVQQALVYLEQGGEPAVFAQVFRQSALVQALPASLMAALGRLWKKGEAAPSDQSPAGAAAQGVEEALFSRLTPGLKAQAPVLLAGKDPAQLALLLKEGNEEALANLLRDLPSSGLKEALSQPLSPQQAGGWAAALLADGALQTPQQARMVLQQWQHLPLALTLPSPQPGEAAPVRVSVRPPQEADGQEVEITLDLDLSGLGPVQARLRCPRQGGAVKLLLRAQNGEGLRALQSDLDALRDDAVQQGVALTVATARLPAAPPEEEGGVDVHV